MSIPKISSRFVFIRENYRRFDVLNVPRPKVPITSRPISPHSIRLNFMVSGTRMDVSSKETYLQKLSKTNYIW